MTLKQRQQAFVQLGLFINRHFQNKKDQKEERFHNDLTALTELAFSYNGWFTQAETERALTGIAQMLDEQKLENFSASVKEPSAIKTVAIIMAGNIPAVGFHDLLCVLLSGHRVLIKVSTDDPALIPFLAGMLIYYQKDFSECINFSEAKLANFDAVIATGSNNTAKHFEYYFGKYPHIIRKNRTSVAALTGNETTSELGELGKDVFYYYGLGCRSVGKVFVPENYNFDLLFESLFSYNYVANNKKYFNNHEYNRAIYLLDQIPFLDNNFFMITQNASMHAPTAVLYYETYTNETALVEKIDSEIENLQCIVGNFDKFKKRCIPFGHSQFPLLTDFADGINTIDFLSGL